MFNLFHRSFILGLMGLTLAVSSTALAGPGPATQDPAKVPAGLYVLDKGHASLVARIGHMGFSRYTMRFNKLDGQFTYDPSAVASTRLSVTIDPASIDTGSDSFSRTLTGPSWLNTAAYPTITFTATDVTPGADGHGSVTGDLTFLGVTRPIVLDVLFNGYGPGFPLGAKAGFSATAHIKRSEFGLKTYLPLVSDDVDLMIEVEFNRR